MLLFSDFGFWSYVFYLVIKKLVLIYNWLPFHFLLAYPPFVCINIFLHHFPLLAPLIFRPHIKPCAKNKHTLSHLLCKSFLLLFSCWISCLSPATLHCASLFSSHQEIHLFSHLFLKLYFPKRFLCIGYKWRIFFFFLKQ